MTIETLPSRELKNSPREAMTLNENLSQANVTLTTERSLTMVEQLKPVISRNLLFALEERIQGQKQELEQLLGLSKNKIAGMEKYSNVLDGQYFEQEFFSE